jgi:hypothetical protein
LSADWKQLSREAGLPLDGCVLAVPCGGGRRQHVTIDDSGDGVIRLWSMVVTHGSAPPNAALKLWKMNRYRELVGFKVAEYGRVIGECSIPTIGITAAEWKLYVETLAHACDHLEYLWIGRDSE